MTALAGVWRFDGGSATSDCLRVLKAQTIYGPHGSAHKQNGGIALGRALHRILPEDRFDRQPVIGGGGRFLLVADVRLDNRAELAAALGLERDRTTVMADAAFLLAAWERWEENAFDHLLGDYAFALWDSSTQRLILARDPLGVRPLHFHRGAGFVAVASMPKGLLGLPQVPQNPDEGRVAELLALFPDTGSSSFYSGIGRVEPGQVVTLTAERTVTRLHWQPRREVLRLPKAEDYADALREQFDRAVGVRLRGVEGHVAAHLSGGRDSGAVAATAARLLSSSRGTVTAFTSVPRKGYDQRDPVGRFGDEGPRAAETAALHPNLEHVLVRTGDRGMLDGLDRAFFLYDRPLLNVCNQRWLEAINDAARERHHSVLLTGQMGNMTISHDGLEWLSELVGSGKLLRLLRECRHLVKAGRVDWREALARSFGPWIPVPLWQALHRIAGKRVYDRALYSALSPVRRSRLDLERRTPGHSSAVANRSRRDSWEMRLSVLRRFDFGNYNKGVLGGWGLDLRDPTADRRLVEFCLSVPPERYLENGTPAALMARAFSDRLPAAVLEGRSKGLQAVDWHEGLTAARERLRTEVNRLREVPQAAGAIDLSRMAQLLDDWPEGDWNSPEHIQEYRLALLRGIAAGYFLRKASGSNA